MNKEDYNNMPVAACKHCKSLYIVTDDLGNERCMRCSSINEVVVYSNIEEYNKENDIKETT